MSTFITPIPLADVLAQKASSVKKSKSKPTPAAAPLAAIVKKRVKKASSSSTKKKTTPFPKFVYVLADSKSGKLLAAHANEFSAQCEYWRLVSESHSQCEIHKLALEKQ